MLRQSWLGWGHGKACLLSHFGFKGGNRIHTIIIKRSYLLCHALIVSVISFSSQSLELFLSYWSFISIGAWRLRLRIDFKQPKSYFDQFHWLLQEWAFFNIQFLLVSSSLTYSAAFQPINSFINLLWLFFFPLYATQDKMLLWALDSPYKSMGSIMSDLGIKSTSSSGVWDISEVGLLFFQIIVRRLLGFGNKGEIFSGQNGHLTIKSQLFS